MPWKQSHVVLSFLISASAAAMGSFWVVDVWDKKDYLSLITRSAFVWTTLMHRSNAITPFEMMNYAVLFGFDSGKCRTAMDRKITVFLASVVVIFAASE